MGLAEFLDQSAARPFVRGEHDCLHWLADWCAILTGKDPAGEWRGRYRTAIGQVRFLKRQGGLLAFVGRQAAEIRLAPVETPQAGAVGVLGLRWNEGPAEITGGIFTGRRWAVLNEHRGVCFFPVQALAAWGEPCPR